MKTYSKRLVVVLASLVVVCVASSRSMAADALSYLGIVQDQYHKSVHVYTDADAGGNHFFAIQYVPDGNAPITLSMSSAQAARTNGGGATGISFAAALQPGQSAGIVLQPGVMTGAGGVPEPEYGDTPNVGMDLTGATSVTFYARLTQGSGPVKFYLGNVGWPNDAPFKDSLEEVSATFQLATQWPVVPYMIKIPAGRDLSDVRGAFAFGSGYDDHQGGFKIELDDIQWNLSDDAAKARLKLPRFLNSFETRPVQPDPFDDNKLDDFDLVLRNAASTYDNAVAGIALLADNTLDSDGRAGIIANAMVYAMKNDRFFTEQNRRRLRTFYRSGDISLPRGWKPNGKGGTTSIPGYYDDTPGRERKFYEIEQEASDVGANVWAGLFLLHAYQRFGNDDYLTAAEEIADFVRSLPKPEGSFGGFRGGIMDPEGPDPKPRPWSSTEHNIDIVAFARQAYRITGNEIYLDDLERARSFVEKMYDPSIGLYRTGTLNDFNRNEEPEQLPIDVNSWAVLADPTTLLRHPGLLERAIATFETTDNGFTGVDFNSFDKDGVQFEMTAQLVVALMAGSEMNQKADFYLGELRRAQHADGGLPAASRDGLTTGFPTPGGVPFLYYNAKHVGATAWFALAEAGVNPYTLGPARVRPGDFDLDGDVDSADLSLWKQGFGKTGALAFLSGDADGNGDVDGSDFLVWQRNVGANSATGNVPEPMMGYSGIAGSLLVIRCLADRFRAARHRR